MEKFKIVISGCRIGMNMDDEFTRNDKKGGDEEGNSEPGARKTEKSKKISWRLRDAKWFPKFPAGRH